MQVITKSRHQLALAVNAISSAHQDGYSSQSTLASVATGRQQLLSTVRSWTPPTGGEVLQRQLVETLRLSIKSDKLYERYAGDLAVGNQSGADQAYAQARANDEHYATPAKRRFLRAFNSYRVHNGLAPIPTDSLY